jgi:membrane protease YdiL (CAAX protease family)
MAFLAWGVIASLVVLVFFSQENAQETAGAVQARDDLNLLMIRFQARYILGLRELAGTALGGSEQIYNQAKALNSGPIDQRLRFVVLAGEFGSPEDALQELDNLEKLIDTQITSVTVQQKSLMQALRLLYTDYQQKQFGAPSLTDAQKQELRSELDWFGDLALAPAGRPGAERDAVLRPAFLTAVIALSVFIGALGLFLIGCCGLLVVVVLLYLAKLSVGLNWTSAPAGVYVETFALWLLYYFGLSYALRGVEIDRELRLPMSGLLMLSSLITLVWPVLRGIPWRQVREHVGWTFGPHPLAEPAIGVGCYIMGYPIMVVGLAITLFFMFLQHYLSPAGGGPDDLSNPAHPSHPIVAPLALGSWLDRLVILVLASIIAPIVEETFFRGVLYRHLRQLTWGLGIIVSIIFSGLVSSFIFAVIHPQGLLAVPVLMSLACCFVLIREWRGTLVPCMVAHGVNNGVVLLLAVAFLS